MGQAIAWGFADAGAQVAVVDISLERAQQTAGAIEERGGSCMALRVDGT